MKPRKRFAQHWLRSEKVLDQIVAAAELEGRDSSGSLRDSRSETLRDSRSETLRDRVLEIGPGQGVLTARLLPKVEALVAVELDRDLIKSLVKRFGDLDHFILLEGDILTLDIPQVLANFPKFQNLNKVVANIPYNITGPILQYLLGTIDQPHPTPYDSIVLLVQKEISDRLCATPHQKSFSALSVRVQYLAQCEWICDVPPQAFFPRPKVNSAVIRLRPFVRENAAHNPQHLATLVKVGFASKRKMLRNNLKGLIPEDILLKVFTDLGLDPQYRPENLGVEDWIALSNKIGEYKGGSLTVESEDKEIDN